MKVFFKQICSVMIIFTLLFSDISIIGRSIVNAVYDELESQQIAINNDLDFDVYFKGETGNIHGKHCSIKSGDKLYININLKNTGVALNSAKISIEDNNYKIGNIDNNMVKNVNYENNEIELKDIVYGDNLEIEVPISFQKMQVVDENYFNKVSKIKLSGNLRKNEDETEISSERQIGLIWSEVEDIEVTQDVEKYTRIDNVGVLIQNDLKIKVFENILPKKEEIITINVPIIDDKKAKDVYVIKNGIKMDNIEYNQETCALKIETLENKIWNNGIDTYKIVYIYDEQIGETDRNIFVDTKVDTKLYSCEEYISKEIKEDRSITKKGNVISISHEMTKEQYKGYMYANVNNETLYYELDEIEVSNSNIDKIEFNSISDTFVDSEDNKYAINNSTYFKQTLMNKNQILDLFGENGEVTITTPTQTIIINKDSETNIYGNITIDYQGDTNNNITITTTKPVKEGNLLFKSSKAIKGVTGYNKEQLKIVTGLESNVKVKGITEEDGIARMLLNEPISEAEITLSNNSLSTLEQNRNVKIGINLKTDSNKYNLYKDPTISIKLPDEVTTIEINNDLNNKLYGNQFTLDNQDYDEASKTINLQFTGEQTEFENNVSEGMYVEIDANITLDKYVSSRASKIVMNYTNGNDSEVIHSKEINVDIVSKDGILTYSSINGYNEANDSVEAMSSNVEKAKLDEGKGAKNTTANMVIINNYNEDLTDVAVIGKVPGINDDININNETYKSTIITSLVNNITTNNPTCKIYYSEDANARNNSETWNEQITDISKIRTYKIVPNEGILHAKETLTFTYLFNIPGGLEAGESTYTNYVLLYNYNGQEISTNSTIRLATQEVVSSSDNNNQLLTRAVEAGNENQGNGDAELRSLNGLEVNYIATSAGNELQENDEIYEGQTVKYKFTVKNTTGEDLSNVVITAEQTNAIFYGEVKYEAISTTEEPAYNTYIEQCEDLTEKVFNIEQLRAGEKKTFEYEFAAKEIVDNDEIQGTIKVKADGTEEKLYTLLNNKIKDAKIKCSLYSLNQKEWQLISGDTLLLKANIQNISGEKLQNVYVDVNIPEIAIVDEESIELDLEDNDRYELVEINNDEHKLRYKINEINNQEKIEIKWAVNPQNADIMKEKEIISNSFVTYLQGEENTKYYSNIVEESIQNTLTEITVTQNSDKEENTILNDEDQIVFTSIIENKGILDLNATITDNLPKGLYALDAYYEYDGVTNRLEIEDNTLVEFEMLLKHGTSLKLVITVNVDTTDCKDEDITNIIEVGSTNVAKNSNEKKFRLNIIPRDTEDVEYDTDFDVPTEIEETDKDMDVINDRLNKNEEDDDEDYDYLDGNGRKKGSNNQSNGNNQNVGIYSISGITWLDKDKNGNNDSSDEKISNIKVYLIDATTGKIVEDNNGNKMTTNTNQDGLYEFSSIAKGKYIVAFEYDTDKYRPTIYRKTLVDESKNSDVVEKEITLENENKRVAITDTITIEDTDIDNIDAGFIENEKFDLSLDKYVSRVTVNSNKATMQKQYQNAKLAKVEIKAKNLVNSLVEIEYTINVTNEGELDGYVGEIIDYMPSDLKFDSQLNKGWTLSNDGKLHNITLANEKLGVGQTTTLKLVLTKTMAENNTGLIINNAEINKASNSLNIKDIDSTPGNQNNSEDDMSKAEVIISVGTGLEVFITATTMITMLAIIGGYVYKSKRKEV